MIERERLKELVKENKPIWYYLSGTPTGQPSISQMGALDYVMMGTYNNKLFETKEDLEFWLNYETIQRTETLKLPTWEEFNAEYAKDKGEVLMFDGKRYGSCQFYFEDEQICIYSALCGYVFNKPLNKENYIEACREAKELFLGENK